MIPGPYVIQEMIDAGHSGDPNAEIAGLKRLKTAEGYKVNWRSDDEVEIVRFGLRATRVCD